MSRNTIRQQLGLDTSGMTLSEREKQLYSPINRAVGGISTVLGQLQKQANQEIEFGYPDDGAGTAAVQNIVGAWSSKLITGGLGGAFTFTHNLGTAAQKTLLTVVPGRAYNYANVRWAIVNFTHGDRTGTQAGPAAAANAAHNSVHFLLGDAVTLDAIDLRVHSNLTVNANNPLLVEIFFIPVVI